MRSGSRAASSAYYDAVFADSPKYAQDAEASEYLPAWLAIAALGRMLDGQVVDEQWTGEGHVRAPHVA